MTRISNADQVLLLLRAHLQRSEKQKRKETSGSNAVRASRKESVERLRQLASDGGAPKEALSRALVAGLLAEEFGDDVVNDPGFQSMIDGVHELLGRDQATKDLLDRALADLTSQNGNGGAR